jgi:hypothetical protein
MSPFLKKGDIFSGQKFIKACMVNSILIRNTRECVYPASGGVDTQKIPHVILIPFKTAFTAHVA